MTHIRIVETGTGRVPPSHAPARHHPRPGLQCVQFRTFAAYELESEDRELLQKLISEWRSQYRRPNDARLIEERRGTDRRVLRHERVGCHPIAPLIQEKSTNVFSLDVVHRRQTLAETSS